MPTTPSQLVQSPASTNVEPGMPPFEVSAFSSPAAGSQATATNGAVANQRHVCTGFICTVLVTTALAAGATFTVNLRDGVSGGGSVLGSWPLGLSGAAAVGTVDRVVKAGIAIHGSVGNAMTLEFSAGVASVVESIQFESVNTN